MVFGIAATIIALVAVSFVLTILLFPFWSWIESSFGIESVGHSGPGDWCFLVTLGVTSAALRGTVWLRYWPRGGSR